jgi:tRNA-uridine 2-sulfurtransferase
MSKNKKRVLVAMSGGVDSSVALIKVLEMGYEAIGVTLKLWENKDKITNKVIDSDCNSLDAVNGAKMVCDRLGVHHYTLNFMDLFKNEVVKNFSDEYFSGRTPNPCVRCNSIVKWNALINQLDVFDADMIATGHYARIIKVDDDYKLSKGVDEVKDQSYMLWQIQKEFLKKTILPLGELTKQEVRKIALDYKLINAERSESMDLCFVIDDDYRDFLSEFAPEKIENMTDGEITNEDGETVGIHSGHINYTIGQRKGLGLSFPEPRYVKKILPNENKIIVSKKDKLLSNSCYISKINWMEDISLPIKCKVRIRYNSKGANAQLIKKNDAIFCEFENPQLAVTPGQSMVFYNDALIIGGGIIDE